MVRLEKSARRETLANHNSICHRFFLKPFLCSQYSLRNIYQICINHILIGKLKEGEKVKPIS